MNARSGLGYTPGMSRVPPPEGFLQPADEAPFDAEAYIRATPSENTVRGMFFNSYIAELERRGVALPEERSYISFKLYSLRDWMRFVVPAAKSLWPELPLRGAIRRAGRFAYPTFADSIIGRVTFGVLGKDLRSILRIAGKGYTHSLDPGAAEIRELGTNHAWLILHDVFSYIDTYHVGVFEGVLQVCEREGEVFCRRHSYGEAELFITWD